MKFHMKSSSLDKVFRPALQLVDALFKTNNPSGPTSLFFTIAQLDKGNNASSQIKKMESIVHKQTEIEGAPDTETEVCRIPSSEGKKLHLPALKSS
jgi:hypothetical protein